MADLRENEAEPIHGAIATLSFVQARCLVPISRRASDVVRAGHVVVDGRSG
jgi:hypothetical protein